MKQSIMGAVAGIALLATLPATAQTVIFEDTFDQTTFDLSYNENLNSNLVARQAGGDLDSIWTSLIATAILPEETLQFGPELVGQGFSAPMSMAIRTNLSELVATTAHLAGLAGNKYTVSFRGRLTGNVGGTSSGRSGFAIGSGALNLFGPAAGATATGLSVNIFRDGRIQVYDGDTKISVDAGATAPVVLDNTTYDLIATIDEVNGTLDFTVTNTLSGASFTGDQVDISGVDLGFERKIALEHNTDGGFPENWEGTPTKQLSWLVDDLNVTRIELGPPGDEIVFRDTYDVISDTNLWDNLNTELATRQAVGSVGSTYTLTIPANDSVYIGPVLVGQLFNKPVGLRVQPDGLTAFDLDTDFGPHLAGETWSLSFDGRLNLSPAHTAPGGYVGWTGFSVGNPANTPWGSGVSVLWNLNGGVSIYTNGVSAGNSSTLHNMYWETYTMTATFDEVAETIGLTYLSATTNMNIGTFSTAGAFADSSRFVEFRNTVNSTTRPDLYIDWMVDNLMIVKSYAPPTIGNIMIALLPSGTDVGITWDSALGLDYTLEERTDLIDDWSTNTTGIAGTGVDITVTSAVSQAQSFYRVTGE